MLDYQYIIFDIDGTLVDSGPVLQPLFFKALEHEGFGDLATPESLNLLVGVALHDGLRQNLGMSDEHSESFIEYFDGLYKEKVPSNSRLIDGVEDMLNRLYNSGKTLTVATNGSTENAELLLEGCGIANYFTGIFGLTTLGALENKDDVIRRVLDTLHIDDKRKAVMVGDRNFDIIAARECGLDSIGILSGGLGSREELEEAGAVFIVNSGSELCDLLLDS